MGDTPRSGNGSASWAYLGMSGDAREAWDFVEGDWSESDDGVITPPTASVDENLAFFVGSAYEDFEARFDFRWDYLICDAGFMFRALDAQHYYLVHFPCTGQQYRAEYFWAAVSRVDASGWVEVLKTETVYGVPSEIGTWHEVRVNVLGDEIRISIDGRPFPPVHDAAYSGPGCVGLLSNSGVGEGARSSFRNLRIRGVSERHASWDSTVRPRKNWFYPTEEKTYGDVLHLSSIARAPRGDLLIKLNAGSDFHGTEWTPVLIRSSDNGRTWSPHERLPDRLHRAVLHNTLDGRLMMLEMHHEPPFPIRVAESGDDGRTWSAFTDCGHVEFPSDVDVAVANQLLELRDGALVWFLYNHTTRDIGDSGHPYGSYCIRSVDGGRTWSQPVSLDGPRPEGYEHYGMITKHFGSETSAPQTRDGRIVAFVRPYWAPVMWETWSEDGGRTWTPASRAPFGMWAATCSMTSTESGALLIAGRHPGLAFQLSHDDGITWRCRRFDTSFWANGSTYEIEPDVVLYASTANYSDPNVRIHLIRVTPDGAEPVRVDSERT